MIEFRPSEPNDLPALRKLWKDAFGDEDAYLDIFFRTAYHPSRSRVLIRDGNPTGGAYWLDCSFQGRKLAYLYAVAIAPEAQGKGLGSALMEDIHRQLSGEGYCGTILVPGEEGLRQYYRRFGYETVSVRRELPPAAEVVSSFQKIGSHRFAELRRQYLPPNGIVQEGENLALLEALAEFYEGDGCIAAVSREDEKCLELLPCPSGQASPYAMASTLTDEPLPHALYFGFGFG